MQKIKKLSTVLAIFAMALLLILNGITATIIAFISSSEMNQQKNIYLSQISRNASNQITSFLEKYVALADTMAHQRAVIELIQSFTPETPLPQSPYTASMFDEFNKVISKHDDMLAVFIGSVAEGYLYGRNSNGEYIQVPFTTRPDYQKILQGKPFFADPFFSDLVPGLLITSAVIPIMNQGSVIGAMFLDLNMEQISKFLTNLAFGESGRVLLMNQNDVIIGYENPDMLNQNFSKLGATGKDLANQINNPTGEAVRYRLGNQEKIGIITRIPGFDWKVFCGISMKEYHQQTVEMTVTLVAILAVSTIVMSTWIYYLVTKRLRPISEINQGLRDMREGNLKLSIYYHGHDEIGEMADSMRDCATTLSSYVEEIDRVMGHLASGDLTVTSSLKFKGDFLPIQQSISTFVQKLTELVQNIHRASQQVSSGSDQVSGGAQALSQGTTQQAASIETLASTLSNVSNTVQDNTNMAVEANEGMLRVSADILESEQKMRQSLSMMEEIRNSSNKISHITKTIEDIAFQTNILALNAAVEAARAGTAGKGFAVVADEVRNLAAKSAEASQNTRILIDSSLAAVEKGTHSMEETAKFMENVVQVTQEITQSFQTIVQVSQDQAGSIARITDGIDQISSVVQTNSATAEESAAASEELSGQSQILKQLIDQFKLDQKDQDEESPSPSPVLPSSMMGDFSPPDMSYPSSPESIFSKY